MIRIHFSFDYCGITNKPTFKSNHIIGTFKSKRGQDAVAFHEDIGVPAEEAAEMDGIETVAMNLPGKNGQLELGWEVEAAPAMNGNMSVEFGTALNIDNPMFGGKTELTFWLIGDNHVIILAKSESYGTMVLNEVYDEDGIAITYMHRESGKTMTEKWRRHSNCIKKQ